jgi:tetraacyldisaccharide 4'-kinase
VICIGGTALQSEKPVFESQITPDTIDLNQKYVAFAGLGRPEKFLNTLENLNADIVDWHEFSDHHLYTVYEIENLLKEATQKQAQLITTEKDHMRLPNDFKSQIKTLPITLNFKDNEAVINFLSNNLN